MRTTSMPRSMWERGCEVARLGEVRIAAAVAIERALVEIADGEDVEALELGGVAQQVRAPVAESGEADAHAPAALQPAASFPRRARRRVVSPGTPARSNVSGLCVRARRET
jgi:hypothetical protein